MHVVSIGITILLCIELCVANDTEMASQQTNSSNLSSADIEKVHEIIQVLSSAAFVAPSNRELANPRPTVQSSTPQTVAAQEVRSEHRGRSRNGGGERPRGEPPMATLVEQSHATAMLNNNLPRPSMATALSEPHDHSSRETLRHEQGTANPV